MRFASQHFRGRTAGVAHVGVGRKGFIIQWLPRANANDERNVQYDAAVTIRKDEPPFTELFACTMLRLFVKDDKSPKKKRKKRISLDCRYQVPVDISGMWLKKVP